MFIFIITDSEKNAQAEKFYQIKFILEEMAGDICLMLRYNQITLSLFEELRPTAICHSGGSATFDEYDVLQHPDYRSVITQWPGPQIGFCGGHQILAHRFGSALGRMHALGENEADHNPGYHPHWFKEWGVYPVRIVKPDPLFEGLGAVIRVQEFHADEVKELGPDLELLASSDHCRVQAFRHRQKPAYGVQFHPEKASEHYPDGFQILRNFFKMARSSYGKT